MYAIIETGGKQYKVQPGEVVEVELLEPRTGKVTFDRVLLCADGEKVRVGTPTVEGARVTGEIVRELRGPKTIAFRTRKRKDSKQTIGHRQSYLRVRIDEIAAV